MRYLKNKLLSYSKRLRYKLAAPSLPRSFLHENVPYFSQWESPELVAKIMSKEIAAKDDPNWRRSGASTPEEYSDWSWNGCGMACTKMLLAHRTGKVTPLVTLAKKCAEYGGYTMPLEKSIGLIYKPYLDFISKELDWHGKIATNMPIIEVISELANGAMPIVSVSPAIRDPKSKAVTKGGHLILLLGYDSDKREIYFHNPSGTTKATQAYAAISFDDFEKFFSGRGIIIAT